MENTHTYVRVIDYRVRVPIRDPVYLKRRFAELTWGIRFFLIATKGRPTQCTQRISMTVNKVTRLYIHLTIVP